MLDEIMKVLGYEREQPHWSQIWCTECGDPASWEYTAPGGAHGYYCDECHSDLADRAPGECDAD